MNWLLTRFVAILKVVVRAQVSLGCSAGVEGLNKFPTMSKQEKLGKS